MRKIIHIDMDCFYAAIEERENPSLRGKPVAVGGSSRRGVLTTANYEARKYGCRSAMPVFKALELCPHLILVPVRFELYRAASARIRSIFSRFTELIEPLSLDEAYLDVSHLSTSSAAIAREIRAQIWEETRLTASAGIASNKMLAKIASDWNKPNGQYEVTEENLSAFVTALPVGKLWGVGKKSREKLAEMGVETCADLQKFEKVELARLFGKWGIELWNLCRGIDDRAVSPERTRKSVSSERTFAENLLSLEDLIPPMRRLIAEVVEEISLKHSDREIRSLVVKLKFADFERTTAERAGNIPDPEIYEELAAEAWKRGRGRPVRLIGAGVRFADRKDEEQLDLFEGLA
ncbi:DNA polymerase IV [Luteolibacter pohnpeiensis]|uniref:DNA polymerase IV n=1 Tax=Luteolibacter pohnpeiensis TaxID=454153 RepID=A0A934VX68_9BACT|nr:DNA polymerase IV [Luteolibacter pohnpeiensis]MBK1883234.1 DNA polymerase IV [Luteolibacter pohnpeiensis]